ncbi:MAG TPA: hypothetical protein VMJ34_21090 [Bryobacteraceae bacterium]|nr:hypothetical protein [Bryobacteraceae bacterium]
MGSTGTLTYACSICAEPSHDVCVYCTKDVCHSHRCQRCLRCSDCCECESPLCLDEEPAVEAAAETLAIEEAPAIAPTPEPEPVAQFSEPAAPDQPSPREHSSDIVPDGSL